MRVRSAKYLAQQRAYGDALRADPERRARQNAQKRKSYQKRMTDPAQREKINTRQRVRNSALRGWTVREYVIEKYLCDAIEKRGGFCPKFIDGSRRGAPDRLVIVPGNPVYFVELKRPALGRVAPWQKRYHDQLRACDQKVWILRSIEEVDFFLETIST